MAALGTEKNARRAALAAMGLVWRKGFHPKDALERFQDGISGRDRAFLMELSYGVLRNRDLLDYVMKDLLRKPPGPLTQDNLRLAAYQVLFMRVPERAAVHEAVEIEKARPGGKPALVNGVLRTFLREKETVEERLARLRHMAENKEAPAGERARAVSLLTSHPAWLVKRWTRRLGPEAALALCTANNSAPPLTLRVNLLASTRNEVLKTLSDRGVQAGACLYSPAGVNVYGAAFRELEFLHALATPQDEAAQLVGYLLAPKPGEEVLDACAAPGGKSTHMAELMQDRGEVVSVDIDPERARMIGENTNRLGLRSVKVITADITRIEWKSRFDRVLLDAPCSALGVIRRNPDIKYRRFEKDLRANGEKQLELLRAVSGMLRPGGLLVYATCSTEPEEGEDVIRAFLGGQAGAFGAEMPEAGFFSPLFKEEGSPYMRTWPHLHGMDGFFAAVLRKYN